MTSKYTNKNGVKLLATVAVLAMVFAAVGVCIANDSDATDPEFSLRFSNGSNLIYTSSVDGSGKQIFTVSGFTTPAVGTESITPNNPDYKTFDDWFGTSGRYTSTSVNYTYAVITGSGLTDIKTVQQTNPALKNNVFYTTEKLTSDTTIDGESGEKSKTYATAIDASSEGFVFLIPQTSDHKVTFVFTHSDNSTKTVEINFTDVTALRANNFETVSQNITAAKTATKDIYVTADVTISNTLSMAGYNICIASGKTLTVDCTRTGGNAFSAISSTGDLKIIGGTLRIDVDGVSTAASGSESTYGINIGDNNLLIRNCALNIKVSSSTTASENDILAFAVKALETITLDNVTGTIAGGNRAIQLDEKTLTINNSTITLKGAEKAIQAKSGTVDINGSNVTLELVDPMVGSNTGADDRFGLKVETLDVDANSTLTTAGLRVLTSASVAGTLNVTYDATGGRTASEGKAAIPAGLILYGENSSNPSSATTLTISGNGRVLVASGNAIAGKISAGSFNDATFGAYDSSAKILKTVKATSLMTFSVGSLVIDGAVGSYTTDANTGDITVTGDIKISGESDVKIIISSGAKVTVPSGKTLTLNNEMKLNGDNASIEVVGDLVGTGSITKASGATGTTVNATDSAAVQSMVDPAASIVVSSNETSISQTVSATIDASTASAIESKFESYTAVYLTGVTASKLASGVTLTIPATGTLYLNGIALTIDDGATLNINGKVMIGAPAGVSGQDSSNSKIIVKGNLYLDGADVRAPVDVKDTAYVSIANAKTMKVEGSATSELDVGYGNTLVLTDITIPSGRIVNAYGTVQVNGTVTVSKGAQFNVYYGGNAEIIGNLVINGVANISGNATVDGTVKVTNDNGGAFLNVLAGGKMTVTENATLTISKSKTAVENKLDATGTLDIEGTLVVTGTLKGTVNDKGNITFNGKSESATIRLFDGMSITITAVTGTITVTDSGIIDVNDYNGNVASYIGNSVYITDAKNVTVSEEITESVKAQGTSNVRYLVGTMTVTGVVTAVDESAVAYASVKVSNGNTETAHKYSDVASINAPMVKQKIIVNDMTLGKNVKLDLDGKGINVKGNVTAIAKTSLVVTTQKATVSGSITIGPECGKTGSVQADPLNVDAVKYTVQDAEANITTYYTTFSEALNATAYENSYDVIGSITIKDELSIPAEYKVTLLTGATLTIDSAGILTVADAGLLDGAAGTIKVDGKLVVTDKDSGLKFNTGAGKFTYQVYTESGSSAIYTGLLGALEASVSGDVITLMQSATLNKDATVKEGVTLVIPKNITLTMGSTTADIKLTVNGKLDIQGAIAKDSSYKTVIAVNGAIAVTGSFTPATFELKDYATFTEKVDGKNTTFYSNLTFASETITDGNVTVYGDVSAGDIKFTKAERATGIVVKFATSGVNTISVGSMKLSGAELQTAGGKVSGTIVATAAGSDAQIQLNGATGVTITSMSTVETLGTIDYLKITGVSGSSYELTGNVTITTGTVTLGGDLKVGKTTSDVLTVADGATLAVVNGTTLTVDQMNAPAGTAKYYGLTVDGTVSVVKGTLTITGWALVNGTISIEDSETSTVTASTGKIQINGALNIVSTDDKKAKITVDGTAVIGNAPTLGANGTISGPIYIETGEAAIIVFAGADSESAKLMSASTDAKASEIYVNGIPFMTVYTNTNNSVNISDIASYIKVEGYDNPTNNSWSFNGESLETSAVVSSYAKIDCKITASYVDLTYSEGVGLVMYIDGLGMQNYYVTNQGYKIQIGTHTVSFAVISGYDDSKVTITVNGKTIGSDGKFEVTPDMEEIVIIVSGAVPSVTPTPEPTPVEPAKDDSMGITEYLLIVLVILAAILVVVVAIRMMRS